MKVTCSWCHELNDVSTGRFCTRCGHRADLPRMECDCPRCRPQTSAEMQEREADTTELTLTQMERDTLSQAGLLSLLEECKKQVNGTLDEDFKVTVPDGTVTYYLTSDVLAALKERCDPEQFEPFLRRKLNDVLLYGFWS